MVKSVRSSLEEFVSVFDIEQTHEFNKQANYYQHHYVRESLEEYDGLYKNFDNLGISLNNGRYGAYGNLIGDSLLSFSNNRFTEIITPSIYNRFENTSNNFFSLHTNLNFHKSILNNLRDDLKSILSIEFENRYQLISLKEKSILLNESNLIFQRINLKAKKYDSISFQHDIVHSLYSNITKQLSSICDIINEIDDVGFEVILTKLRHTFKRGIKITQKGSSHIRALLYSKVTRDLRIFYRYIIQFLFKNLDDESHPVANNSNIPKKFLELFNHKTVIKYGKPDKGKTYRTFRPSYQV